MIWEPAELVAVSSLDERSGRRLEQTYGCRWYGDYTAMLRQETLDGVLITSPDHLHAEHGMACIESGTVHLFDLTRYFMGDVRSVSAVGVNKYGRNKQAYPIDNAIITLEFVSGSIGMLSTASTALSLKPWERVEIYGNKAWLAVEDQCELILYDSEAGPAKSWRPVIPNTLIFDEEFGGYMGQVENFLQAIRGAEQPLVTGWDGHHALELCRAAHRSLEQRGKVLLPLEE